jgi:hypothetical protein
MAGMVHSSAVATYSHARRLKGNPAFATPRISGRRRSWSPPGDAAIARNDTAPVSGRDVANRFSADNFGPV